MADVIVGWAFLIVSVLALLGWVTVCNMRTRHREVVAFLNASEDERLRLRAFHDRVMARRSS
jgi:hypothetical protein